MQCVADGKSQRHIQLSTFLLLGSGAHKGGGGTRARAPPLAISGARGRRKKDKNKIIIKNFNGKFGQLQTFLTCNSTA